MNSELRPSASQEHDSGPPAWISRAARIVILLGVVGIAAEIGILSYKRLLTADPAPGPPQGAQALPGPLPAGTILGGLETRDFEDTTGPFTEQLQQPPTIVFLFTTTCPTCQQTMSAWNDFYAETAASNGGAQIVGLSLDPLQDTRDFVAAYGVEFPVEVVIDRRSLDAQIRPVYVPQTLVLDADGVVLNAWTGLFEGEIPGGVAAATAPRQTGSGSH